MHVFQRGLDLALVWTLVVILIGAWVRLTDAGLGCPDWPGCYGHLTSLPETTDEVRRAIEQDPRGRYDRNAALREMSHRYIAGGLGVLILVLTVAGFWHARNRQIRNALLSLLALVVFQALLGMWTVTLRLQPLVVTAHLYGGFAMLALLWWIRIRQHRQFYPQHARRWVRALCLTALIALIAQIGLGGWTSANYAALACPDFPTCRDTWWPAEMDFAEGFVLWRGTDIDYEFGVLDNAARTAIHMAHRTGAAVVTFLVLLLGLWSIQALAVRIRRVGHVLLGLLLVQVSLGISNIVFHLPLAVAVAHNGTAALLLLAVLTQYRQVRKPS